MHFKLSEEHEMIRKMVRDFAKNEVAPTAAEHDEEERFDRELFDQMAELGLTGIPWPEEYGGIGSDYLAYVIAHASALTKTCARCLRMRSRSIGALPNTMSIQPLSRMNPERTSLAASGYTTTGRLTSAPGNTTGATSLPKA